MFASWYVEEAKKKKKKKDSGAKQTSEVTPEVQTPASDEKSQQSKEESQRSKRQRPDEVEPKMSDTESVGSEVEVPSRSKRSQAKKTGGDAIRIIFLSIHVIKIFLIAEQSQTCL